MAAAIGTNDSTGKSAEAFASGEVAYALGSAWGQTIGGEKFPVLGGTQVFLAEDCQGGLTVYSNKEGTTWLHKYENGVCTICGSTKTQYATGDINGDGSITILDISALVRSASGGTIDFCAPPDVNGDGSITALDISALVEIALGS